MVVKIQPAAHNMSNAVDYNERKMSSPEDILSPDEAVYYMDDDNTGHVVATVNVPELSTLENEFHRLEMKNERNTRGRKLENAVFHMSINPGEQDVPMSEADILRFTKELMERLGYGDSPYRLYRHDDTGRTHYHVVTTRIGQDGKKIKDSFENARCESVCRELATKYGYVYGLQEESEQRVQTEGDARIETPAATPPQQGQERPSRNEIREKKNPPAGGSDTAKTPGNGKDYVPPFNLEDGVPATDQYRRFHGEAMKWSFTTPEQYAALLRWRYNTDVKIYDDKLYYIGLDEKGYGCTPPVNETELGISALDNMLQRCADTKMSQKKAQRKRLEELSAWAAGKSDTWEAFRKTMERKGVYVAVSWSENDEPFGVTWIDRATKCIWKGSETDATIGWLKTTAREKGWNMKRHWKYERRSREMNLAATPPARAAGTTGEESLRSGSLSKVSTLEALKDLMSRRGVKPSRRSNADASRGRRLRYGEDDDPNEIII